MRNMVQRTSRYSIICARNDRQYRHDDLAYANDLYDLESVNESMINRRRSVRGIPIRSIISFSYTRHQSECSILAASLQKLRS